jgi:hypothetical protein
MLSGPKDHHHRPAAGSRPGASDQEVTMSNTPTRNTDDQFASQPKFTHSGGKPGDKIPGTRKVSVTGRDPRAGKPAKVRNPGRAHR